MMANLLLTVVSPDRPGVIEQISRIVAEATGNWQGGRFCRLGGQFAGIVQVQLPEAKNEELQKNLAALAGQGVRIEVAENVPAEIDPNETTVQIELMAGDRPGIVRELSTQLAKLGVNMEDLSTECVSAPMSGESLFKAQATVRLTGKTGEEDIRQALESLSNDIMVEIITELDVTPDL